MRSALAWSASYSFFLLVAALPWTVAPMSIALVLCAALTILVWQFPDRDEPVRWLRTPVEIPAIVWIVALAVAALFAVDPHASWPRVTKVLLLLLIPVTVDHAREESTARRAVTILIVSAVAAAIFALGKFIAQGPEFPNRVKGAVGHPLTYGGQVMLVASLASALRIPADSRA